MVTFGLAFLAGILSVLSPCILPLVPIVLATAASQHRWGALALIVGLGLSFTAIGLFVGTIGFAIGFDEDKFRFVAAIVLLLIGLVLLVPAAQTRIAMAGSQFGSWTEQRWHGVPAGGWQAQFGVGLLLGVVWSPCAGPTLGAASVLAAQGKSLPSVAVTMFLFGLGAALPMALLGMMSREALLRWRSRMADAGRLSKAAFGCVLVGVAVAVMTGFDQRLEAALVSDAPGWLTTVTTRY